MNPPVNRDTPTDFGVEQNDRDEVAETSDHSHSNGNGHIGPLPRDATLGEIISAINILTKAVDMLAKAGNQQAVDVQLIREAVQEMGTRQETFCERIERAVERVRQPKSDRPPSGE